MVAGKISRLAVRNGLAAVTALLLCSTAGTSALAQGFSGSDLHAGQLEVPLNKSQVVTADAAISRAMVGNAEVADVFPISDRSVYVLGKKIGTTSLTLYDRGNRVISVLDVAVGPDVISLRKQLAELVPGEEIEARISNSSIVLSGLVSDPGKADKAVRLAGAYAGEDVINLMSLGSSQQIMLEVKFSEVSRQAGKQLGIRSFGISDGGSFEWAIGDGSRLVRGEDGTGVLELAEVTDTFGVFRKTFGAFGTNIEAILDALERKGLVHTLAEPTLVALSGEKASFLAGGEFPIPVQQGNNAGGNNGITVEFKPFGVGLGFTPTVLGDSVINLVVEPEVSSIDPSASVTINGLTVPGLQTRRASTTLELRDGESFAIAGLLQRDITTAVRQLPILGSLPIIGALFRSSDFQKGETELLIVVTPRLVKPIRPDQVQLPTDRVMEPTGPNVILRGASHRTRRLAPAEAATPQSQAEPVNPAGQAEAPDQPVADANKTEDGYEY